MTDRNNQFGKDYQELYTGGSDELDPSIFEEGTSNESWLNQYSAPREERHRLTQDAVRKAILEHGDIRINPMVLDAIPGFENYRDTSGKLRAGFQAKLQHHYAKKYNCRPEQVKVTDGYELLLGEEIRFEKDLTVREGYYAEGITPLEEMRPELLNYNEGLEQARYVVKIEVNEKVFFRVLEENEKGQMTKKDWNAHIVEADALTMSFPKIEAIALRSEEAQRRIFKQLRKTKQPSQFLRMIESEFPVRAGKEYIQLMKTHHGLIIRLILENGAAQLFDISDFLGAIDFADVGKKRSPSARQQRLQDSQDQLEQQKAEFAELPPEQQIISARQKIKAFIHDQYGNPRTWQDRAMSKSEIESWGHLVSTTIANEKRSDEILVKAAKGDINEFFKLALMSFKSYSANGKITEAVYRKLAIYISQEFGYALTTDATAMKTPKGMLRFKQVA